MSLADELIADLEDEDSSDSGDETDENGMQFEAQSQEKRLESLKEELRNQPIDSIAKLVKSERLKNVLYNISYYKDKFNDELEGKMVDESKILPEYELIVQSNALMSDIDEEIALIHKFLRDLYNKRFPELESLVTSPYDYIQSVYYLKNIDDPTNLTGIDFLSPAIKMVVSVTASTTIGTTLSDYDLEQLQQACEMAFDLSRDKFLIFEFVQSRLKYIAPNLSALLSPSTAAQLMGAAGGLISLSSMPSCNIQTLGSKKKSLAGFSVTSTLPHTGFIFYNDLVQKQVPPYLRRKATRLLACKATMAIRMDLSKENMDGSFGTKLQEEVLVKVAKWQEPPSVKNVKAMPVPVFGRQKRRGGRRQKRMKEKFAVTELRRQANIVNFGQIQEDVYQTAIGFGLGSVGHSSGTGKIRTAAIDDKTRVSISKRLQKRLANLNSTLGGVTSVRSQIAGTASSVVFTPLQGLEIINPAARENQIDPKSTSTSQNPGETASRKYFGNAGFNLSKKLEPTDFKKPTSKPMKSFKEIENK